ncbi:hypothetical protein [Psychromonas sp. Urea-02u-13]|uniref:hypothetical protein n=1 Tax=Psychromonas sp. Urea-02u-13 TaxID=2058326 RepID=UPI000C33DEA1|nr:hypothetical protein [Psychromonas sp. Urea-02u-13]PKG37716.1 hypothetical protein CXF74_17430 [Psychromonas sp. Urea-02u-13]
MNSYQQVQAVLDAPTEFGHYWHNQFSLSQATGLTQSVISKQLAKLLKAEIVQVELREYAVGKTGKHYCLTAKLDAKETAQQTAHAQLTNAIEVLANDLKSNNKLEADLYKSLLAQIKDVSAIVRGESVLKSDAIKLSVFEQQVQRAGIKYKNLNDSQLREYVTAKNADDVKVGNLISKYDNLNKQQA